jgi:hypothetical protein
MSKTVQAGILGVVVALVVGLGFGFVMGLDGQSHTGSAAIGGLGAGVVAAYLFGNLAGNRRIANASSADKTTALDRAPPPGKALLFLYRDGFVAKLAGLNISVDGKPVAQLKSPRFTCIVVPAGTHVIAASFGGLAGAQSLKGECPIEAPADGAAAVKLSAQITMTKGGIGLEPQADVAAVKARLAGMPMTPPDLAEL